MVYLLSDPLFAYGLATLSVLLAVARVVYERRKANWAGFYQQLQSITAEQLGASDQEVRRLNRLLRERDARIADGKADNRNQSYIIKEQAKEIRAKHHHVQSLLSVNARLSARLDRVQNILDTGTCHECPPADQKVS